MKAVVFLCLLVPVSECLQGNFNWGDSQDTNDPLPNLCSTSDASCSCCLINRHMERMLEFFNHSHQYMSIQLTNTKNSINQLRATRSVFSVTLANQNPCLGPFQTNTNIVYQTVIINEGNNYNKDTGVYTAPVSGVYSLSVTIYSNFADQDHTHACAYLAVNGDRVAELKENSIVGDAQDSSSIVITKHLNAMDTVSVIQPPGCAFCGSNHNYNTFTGYLLYLKS